MFAPNEKDFDVVERLATGKVWRMKKWPVRSPFFFFATIATDVDGAPKAYARLHPNIDPTLTIHSTLDNLANAGSPGNWAGVVVDHAGNPIEQDGRTPAQPERGYMISQTTLSANNFPSERDVRHWVDATKIPYIALPSKRQQFKATGLTPGDSALVINPTTGRFCFAVYADSKKFQNRAGEMSLRAAELIGYPGLDGRSGPPGNPLAFTIVFPASGLGQGTIPSEDGLGYNARRDFINFSIKDRYDLFFDAFQAYPVLQQALTFAGYIRFRLLGKEGLPTILDGGTVL